MNDQRPIAAFDVGVSVAGEDAPDDAFVRVLRGDSGLCVLLANAANTGFGRVAPKWSRLILDEAASCLADGKSPGDVFPVVRRSLPSSDADADDGVSGWLTITEILPGSLTVTWASGDVVLHLRGGKEIQRTTAHVYRGPADWKFLVRGLGSAYDQSASTPERTDKPWALDAGDRVLLGSRAVAEWVEGHRPDWAEFSDGAPDTATAIANRAIEQSPHPYAAAVIVDVLEETIEAGRGHG